MPAPSSCAATTTNDFSKLSRPGNYETGKVFSGGTTTYMNEVGQGSCNAGGCALDQGFAMQGPNWQTFNAGMAAVNVSANGRVVLSGINGAPTFLYMYYMDGWILEGSSESGKIAYGELDEQEIPMSQWSLPTTMLLNSATPHQLTEFDASGQLTFSQAIGALASMTGTVDHSRVGTASYGDTFGPWTLQAPNAYGVSQATDGSGNVLGECVTEYANLEVVYLPNTLEPNGAVPTAF